MKLFILAMTVFLLVFMSVCALLYRGAGMDDLSSALAALIVAVTVAGAVISKKTAPTCR